MEQQPMASASAAVSGFKIRHLRWYICGLLFFATVINYIDRQVLGLLAPDLQKDVGWSELEYAHIIISFQISYSVMMLVAGRGIDRIGVKLGFAIAIILWSLAAMGHGVVMNPTMLSFFEPLRKLGAALGGSIMGSALTSIPLLGGLIAFLGSLLIYTNAGTVGFAFMRFLLGIGESANFPTAIKTVAEWFPKSERALATGIFNGGTNIGAILAPIMVPLVAARYGWQGAFIITGVIGFFWLIAWQLLYRKPTDHPYLYSHELEHINQDDPTEEAEKGGAKITLWKLLGYRQLWAVSIGKLLADPIWWFYLFWLPKFMFSEHGVKGTALIPYLATVYLISDFGSILGGYVSSMLIKRGWPVHRSRKTALLIFAGIMPIVIFASQTKSAWIAIILVGIAAAAHQAWSANIFTLSSDMFPKRLVGSVMGFAGFAGGIGGIIVAEFAGRVLQANPRYYTPMFVVAGLTYLLAFFLIHLLTPKFEPAQID